MTRTARALARILAFGSLFTLTLPACRSQAEREASAELERIMQRVHTLQDAATNEKAAPLAQLRAEHCSSAKACELQEVCAQGYSLYEHAQKTTHAVRDAMNAGNSNALLAQQLLDTNEAELERAKMLMDQCVVALGQAARDLRL